MKDYKIIDFHIHPHKGIRQRDHLIISSERIKEELVSFGCYKACGSVVNGKNPNPTWEYIKDLNDTALDLQKQYDGFFIPGFHIHQLSLIFNYQNLSFHQS